MFYSAVSFLLGGHGDHSHDGGIDHGADIGHDIGAGHSVDISHDIGSGHGVDIGHGIDTGHGAAGADAGHDGTHHASHGDDADSPSPFNPLVIASAITTFGAVGLISMTGFGLDGLMSTIVALGFAGAIGVALFFGVVKFMYGSQSNSVFSLDDLIGFEAEVITPVPEKGLGEIAYKANGIRSTLTARSLDGEAIKRGANVIIREITGSVALVQQKLTLDDIVFDNVPENSWEDRENGGPNGPEDTDSPADAADMEDQEHTGNLGNADNGKPRRNAGNKN